MCIWTFRIHERIYIHTYYIYIYIYIDVCTYIYIYMCVCRYVNFNVSSIRATPSSFGPQLSVPGFHELLCARAFHFCFRFRV